MIYPLSDFTHLQAAGKLASSLLDFLTPYVKEGVSTETINDLAETYTQAHGAISAPLGYKGYPKSICTSVNHIVCHGIPTPKKILLNGDIINIDVTVILNGWYGDTSRMYTIGHISTKAQNLIDVTKKCLELGIEQAIPGNYTGAIGHAIQTYAESKGFSVVREYTGHGIGRTFHDEPNILHFGLSTQGIKIVPGMVFTIEPMINVGTWKTKVLSDKWTVVTRDRKLSAQFEHTLGITEIGNKIFTM